MNNLLALHAQADAICQDILSTLSDIDAQSFEHQQRLSASYASFRAVLQEQLQKMGELL